MKLLFATQAVDPADPVLAATVPKVRALASRVDELVVLADRVDRTALPDGVRAYAFGASTKAVRGARFVRALARERPDAVLAHMAPVYALLAAPARARVLLWFTQQRGGRLLRAAERASSVVLTVDERSFPLPSRKLRAIGHGIDLAEFPCRSAPPNPSNTVLLGLGRYAPVKGWDTAIRAVAHVDGARLALYGPMLTDADRAHRPELERLAHSLGAPVEFHDAVPRSEVPALLARATALVNPTRGNAADKVVYEAAASCVPPLAASPVFDALLPPELRFPAGDAAALAGRIRRLDPAIGPQLRDRVAEQHSVEHWADEVVRCL